MASRQKVKGSRFELAIVHAAQAHGLAAKKIPLSGACEGYKDDVQIEGRTYECKVRAASPFTQLYKWLGESAGVFVKMDNHIPLAVIPAERYFQLLATQKGINDRTQ
jgi:hypothetical protein